MANPGYVRSTDGNDADNGSTWALANASLGGAIADGAAGDTIYVSQAHAEVQTTLQALSFPGTLAAPNVIVCGNDAAEPPTATAATATATTTGSVGFTFSGSFYMRGIAFSSGTGGAGGTSALTFFGGSTPSTVTVFEDCSFALGTTSNLQQIRLASSSTNVSHWITWRNCSIRLNATGQEILVALAEFRWEGGGVLSGSATPADGLFLGGASGRSGVIYVDGVNFSNFASTLNLVQAGSIGGPFTFRNCRLPASWTGQLFAGGAPNSPGIRAQMYNCDDGSTNYRLWVQDYAGTARDETTIVRTGGASDGTTPLSWRITTTANASYPTIPFVSPEIVRWNETTGSAITVSVEVITDGVTLTDAQAWLDVQYLAEASYPTSDFVSDGKAILASAANQTSSSVDWTTTGLTSPVKQTLSVTFTPQKKGFLVATVKVARASTTVYVDPLLTVT